MQSEEFQTKHGPLRKYFNRAALAAFTALALGLWTPQLASAITESFPNDNVTEAQDVTGFITLSSDPNVTSSDTIPHVSILGTGDDTFDYYMFSTLGGIIILDIDNTNASNDTQIVIWDAVGTIVAWSDDYSGDPGSETNSFDSFMELFSQPAGVYTVGVCKWLCGYEDGFVMTGNRQQNDDMYTLHISTQVPRINAGTTSTPIPAPEPNTMILLGSGLAGLAAFRRRHKIKKHDA